LNGYQLKKRCFAPTFVSTAQRFSSSLVNRQFSLPIAFTALLFSSFFRGLLPELLIFKFCPSIKGFKQKSGRLPELEGDFYSKLFNI